jgi:hypothetical protein
MLCLPSGERIRLDESRLRLLFEVEDLAAASPATVSRYVCVGGCGAAQELRCSMCACLSYRHSHMAHVCVCVIFCLCDRLHFTCAVHQQQPQVLRARACLQDVTTLHPSSDVAAAACCALQVWHGLHAI